MRKGWKYESSYKTPKYLYERLMNIPTGGEIKEHLALGTEQCNQDKQKAHHSLSSPMLKSTMPHPCSRGTRDGRTKESEQRFSVKGHLCLSSTPYQQPLLTAQEHKGSRGHTVGLSCSSCFSWLSPHHGSSASRGGGRAGSITVINKTSLFLTCKIDHSSSNLSLPSWERSISLKPTLSRERACRPTCSEEVQSKQPAQERLQHRVHDQDRLFLFAAYP